MIKKIFIGLFLLICLTLGTSTIVFASEINYPDNSTINKGLMLYSEQISHNVWTYAHQNFLTHYTVWVSSNSHIRRNNNVFLGTPFTIKGAHNNAVYFPIIADETAKGVLIVVSFEENGRITYLGTITQMLAYELNQLYNLNYTNPIQLAFDNGNIFAQLNNEIILVSSSPWGGEPEWISDNALYNHRHSTNLSIVAPFNKAISDFTLTLPIYVLTDEISEILTDEIMTCNETILDFLFSTTFSNSINTAPFRTEQQFDRPWCGAYATALILRFRTNHTVLPRGYNLMREIFGNVFPYYRLRDKFFRASYVDRVSRSRGFTTIHTGTLTAVNSIRIEIGANRPVYMEANNINLSEAHAWTIRGYTAFSQAVVQSFSVWNPWNRFGYDTMNQLGRIVTVDGRIWQWRSSVLIR